MTKYSMMTVCGLLPHFWNKGRGMSERWHGLDGPEPSVDVVEDEERSEYATEQELAMFPLSRAQDFVYLRRFVYDTCNDWRRIHINEDEETGPEFYIGRSKHSGRWIGLIGESHYEAYI